MTHDITPRPERSPVSFGEIARWIVKISSARLTIQPIPLLPNPVTYI